MSGEPAAAASFPSLRGRANARNGGVNLGAILRFQFGEAKAIRELAASRSAAGVGVVLVFTAATARNYDPKYILESPWIIGPLVVSLSSAFFIYAIIRGGCLWVIYPKGEESPAKKRCTRAARAQLSLLQHPAQVLRSRRDT